MADFDSRSEITSPKNGNSVVATNADLRIAIVGAGGRIARRAISYFYEMYADSPRRNRVELIAVTSNQSSLESELSQIRSTYVLRTAAMREDNFKNLTTRVISNYEGVTQRPDYRALTEADLVVVASHVRPTAEMIATFPTDLRDRSAWSYGNRDMMAETFLNIRGNAPDAKVLILTSDVDDFSALGQDYGLTTYGVGGHLDALRARIIIGNRLQRQLGTSSEKHRAKIQQNINNVLMAGYHDRGMRLLQSTIKGLNLSPRDVEFITDSVATEGIDEIYKVMGRRAESIQEMQSADVMPAFALADVMGAFAGYGDVTATQNVVLTNGDASHYGVPAGTRLGVPTKVSRGNIRVSKISVTDEEKNYFSQVALLKTERYKQLRDWTPMRPQHDGNFVLSAPAPTAGSGSATSNAA